MSPEENAALEPFNVRPFIPSSVHVLSLLLLGHICEYHFSFQGAPGWTACCVIEAKREKREPQRTWAGQVGHLSEDSNHSNNMLFNFLNSLLSTTYCCPSQPTWGQFDCFLWRVSNSPQEDRHRSLKGGGSLKVEEIVKQSMTCIKYLWHGWSLMIFH